MHKALALFHSRLNRKAGYDYLYNNDHRGYLV